MTPAPPNASVNTRESMLALRRQTLLSHLLSPWRRRGAALLQVGLTSGLLPDFFWEAGFDVSALDADSALLATASSQTGPRVDYSLGQPDHLPFDDGTFEYVVLAHLGLHGRTLPKNRASTILAEAVRVAARGIIVLEWNRMAWPLSKEERKNSLWPWALLWQLRHACPGGVLCMRSIMAIPQKPSQKIQSDTGQPQTRGVSQRGQSLLDRLNNTVLPVPLGGILGLRLEKSPLLMTPVGGVTDKKNAPPYAAEAAVNRLADR